MIHILIHGISELAPLVEKFSLKTEQGCSICGGNWFINKTQTAVINIVSFRFFINLTFRMLLLAFSVTSFKIDQNKSQTHSIDKVQNLGNERRYIYIYKDPRKDLG